jgi:CDP-diacylglycerol--serine O-phosphatidyltransferase
MDDTSESEKVRIYFLPNLMTAGNLACGFFALTWIFKYQPTPLVTDFEPIVKAIKLILLGFVFDLFDGRIARMVRLESKFGREFDSLADIVTFGVAPAFLVYRIVLQDFHDTAWLISAVYLVCGGIRLARFNVISGGSDKEFLGFPIPSAAAVVVSVTMFMMWMADKERSLGNWKYILPVLMVMLSILMVSNVRYPTFKRVDWNQLRSVSVLAAIVTIGLLMVQFFQVTLALLFVGYMFYGLVRPWLSQRWRREIEVADGQNPTG